MAKVSFPKFGEIEGGPVFVAAMLSLVLAAALAGLIIWTGDDTAPPPIAPVAVPDDFDDFDLDGPYDYGDDPYLDSLHDGCLAGFAPDCDDLYYESPVGSEYEWIGATCGGLYEPLGGNC